MTSMSDGMNCSPDMDWGRLRHYLDSEGRLKVWPGKWKNRRMVSRYLLRGFTPGTRYTEGQVNEIIEGLHTFGDYAVLRRVLCDLGLLARECDGSAYWLTEKGAAAREAVLALPDTV